MRVIEEGSIPSPKDWVTEIRCNADDKYDKNGCGILLEITQSDLFAAYWHGTHFRHYYTSTLCPRCLKLNRVKDVPATIIAIVLSDEGEAHAVFDGFSEAI